MTNDSIQRYAVSGDIAYPIHEDPEGDYVTYEDHVAAIEADRKRSGEPVAWLHEDELPDNYPYDAMFPYSKVDVVRMFPVYAPQPAETVKDETLWCLHVLGPDDVHAAPSRAYAEVAADLHNARFGKVSKDSGVMCKAVVAPWPHDSASHARGLANFVSNWIAPQPAEPVKVPSAATFQLGDRVRKTKGSRWQGRVVGAYRTTLTPEGYAVESETETGSVQIYPAHALELVEDSE